MTKRGGEGIRMAVLQSTRLLAAADCSCLPFLRASGREIQVTATLCKAKGVAWRQLSRVEQLLGRIALEAKSADEQAKTCRECREKRILINRQLD